MAPRAGRRARDPGPDRGARAAPAAYGRGRRRTGAGARPPVGRGPRGTPRAGPGRRRARRGRAAGRAAPGVRARGSPRRPRGRCPPGAGGGGPARRRPGRRAPPPVSTPPWHLLPADKVLEALDVGPDGLSTRDARRRFRPDAQTAPPRTGFARAFAEELANPLTPIL